jgi:hypothetical protein
LGANPAVNPRPLIEEEDFHASKIAVWELFEGATPFGLYVSVGEDFDLWDRIVGGSTVDVGRIEFDEARIYVKECLSTEACFNVISFGGPTS